MSNVRTHTPDRRNSTTVERGSREPAAVGRTRKMLVIAQDPSIRNSSGQPLTAEIEIPAEDLSPGPRGYRVHVVDYDASSGILYQPAPFQDPKSGQPKVHPPDLASPHFHAQNVYALVMRTLARFEYALGRHVSWKIPGHQIKVVPHAFADANAFYSRRDEALVFGYFPGRKGMVFSCLSHDVIVHETCHALLDGLRERFVDPSSPDQAAFHEGFADVVALLSVFSMPEIAEHMLTMERPGLPKMVKRGRIDTRELKVDPLEDRVLFGLAEEMGQEMGGTRSRALRNSLGIKPRADWRDDDQYQEPHRRGEILVSAMIRTFLRVWKFRLDDLVSRDEDDHYVDLRRTSEEAADAADYLLTMAIRAIDYCPPIHLTFEDYLTAMLTSDAEIHASDERFQYRKHLRDVFAEFGIFPSACADPRSGLWPDWTKPMPAAARSLGPRLDPVELRYDSLRFESLQRDPDEVFRFVWNNLEALRLSRDAYTRIESLRPCLRLGPEDGVPLRETVAECLQWLKVRADELESRLGIKKPEGMPDALEINLQGGITLIFDDFGRLKFGIANRIDDASAQTRRLQELWDHGYFSDGTQARRFAAMHRSRALGASAHAKEVW